MSYFGKHRGGFDSVPLSPVQPSPPVEITANLARDLYQLHQDTGISLDTWTPARSLVEFYYGDIENNNV